MQCLLYSIVLSVTQLVSELASVPSLVSKCVTLNPLSPVIRDYDLRRSVRHKFSENSLQMFFKLLLSS